MRFFRLLFQQVILVVRTERRPKPKQWTLNSETVDGPTLAFCRDVMRVTYAVVDTSQFTGDGEIRGVTLFQPYFLLLHPYSHSSRFEKFVYTNRCVKRANDVGTKKIVHNTCPKENVLTSPKSTTTSTGFARKCIFTCEILYCSRL